MEIFTFNGYDGEKIALKLKEVIGFPDLTSYEGGYDIICSLDIQQQVLCIVFQIN